MLLLDDSVKLIILQFSFSNPSIVPASIKQVESESLDDRKIRKSREDTDTSEIIIEPTENAYLAYFIDDLKTAGYEIVDALYQPRVDPKDLAEKRTYHMVRFLFARTESIEKIYEGFLKIRPTIYTDLEGMCVDAIWRVRALLNPLSKNGKDVYGQHALSINLEVRKPLFNPDDHHVLTWEKDEDGNRIGDEPVPIMPDYCLRIENDFLKLVQ